MGNYCSIKIIPEDAEFYPSQDFIKELFSRLNINKIQITSGEGEPDEDGDGKCLYFLKDVTLIEANESVKKHKPESYHFTVKSDYLDELGKSIESTIPKELSGDFVPWDTGIQVGNWFVFDEDGEPRVFGKFHISKSHSNYPLKPSEYLKAFTNDEKVQELIDFLKSKTGLNWITRIDLS